MGGGRLFIAVTHVLFLFLCMQRVEYLEMGRSAGPVARVTTARCHTAVLPGALTKLSAVW